MSDDNIKDKAEDNTHPEESQYVDDSINDYLKKIYQKWICILMIMNTLI